ncbi:hypothetical protein [Streptomyces sp. NPDC006274]|uniref:hypothetical protein n=1 Tax=unclassified Streptomyces TaxID=2593676 RepID=UPI0033B6F976
MTCAARVEKKPNRMDGGSTHGRPREREAPRLPPGGPPVANLIATVVETGHTGEDPPRPV